MLTLNSKRFRYHPESKTLSAEISELNVGAFPTVFQIKSEKTLKIAKFGYIKGTYDKWGDLLYYTYTSKDTIAYGVKVKIFNDWC